jgi:hypothetical protein
LGTEKSEGEEMSFKTFLTEWTIITEAKSDFKKLQKNKKPLSAEEHSECMKAKAVWNHGPQGQATPAVWKSVGRDGKVTYVTHTHRAFNKATTMKGAIKRYHDFIKGTA